MKWFNLRDVGEGVSALVPWSGPLVALVWRAIKLATLVFELAVGKRQLSHQSSEQLASGQLV